MKRRTALNLLAGVITLAWAPIMLWVHYVDISIYKVYVAMTGVALVFLLVATLLKAFEEVPS